MAKYLAEERETILNYDPTTRTWSAWTNVPEHIRKLQAKGWTINPSRCTVSEGVMIDAWFTAPKNAITFRDLTKPKRVGNAVFNRVKTAETEQTSNLSYSIRNASETLIIAHEIA